MPNLSVTTNADFYHNYTQGSGLSIPKILARIIGMRTVPSRPDSPTCEEKNKQEMSRNNWNSKQWSMCQTQTILQPLYQGCIIIDTIQYWCYHITHHSLCLFPSILKSLDVVPYSWDHLQSWPAPPSPLPVGEIQGYTHITHSLRSELISGIFNKTRYVDTEEGAALHPALDFKTATCIIFQRIERLEIAWLQRWSHIGYWKVEKQ